MRGYLVGAVLSLAIVQPAQAQAVDSNSDLRCAVWATITSSLLEDPSGRATMSFAIGWFAGHYEAATGKSLEQGMTPAYVNSIGDMQVLHAECLPRADELWERFTALGTSLQAAGE
ncbi:hypothetical protein GRI97_08685 [Altererythrobacter xixiisoli]|uniref:HdeA/HdeB family protein n=1 Tax=Croceibacterium xixiisoli TaxID=1476466 RepID=A0A6I4TT56_9SPHN|nr:hypothetical protein [Croceibacterium xixiisoli]MXO99062.1 hypothetical protein [Croceibacterium xixiisoli]